MCQKQNKNSSSGTEQRVCRQCHETKPIELFTKSGKYTLNTCKRCTCANVRQWQIKHRGEPKGTRPIHPETPEGERYCCRCKQIKQESEFSVRYREGSPKNKILRKQFAPYCKPCAVEYQQELRARKKKRDMQQYMEECQQRNEQRKQREQEKMQALQAQQEQVLQEIAAQREKQQRRLEALYAKQQQALQEIAEQREKRAQKKVAKERKAKGRQQPREEHTLPARLCNGDCARATYEQLGIDIVREIPYTEHALLCLLPMGWRTAHSAITQRTILFDANKKKVATFDEIKPKEGLTLC